MFTWHQYQDYADYVLAPKLPKESDPELSYYDAAMALFLVIEDRYGQNAIREITKKVNKLENGTGKDVRGIVNQVLGRDVAQLVKEFRFPYYGFDMVAIYPPYQLAGISASEGLCVGEVAVDSPAQRAGIRRDDLVVSLDGDRTLTPFDFEYALYKHMQQQAVKIGLHRPGAGYLTVDMTVGK
jgi:S1-C subfamily serine protease